MQKTLLAGLVMMLLTKCALTAVPAPPPPTAQPPRDFSFLPAELAVPEALPAGLDDPILLEAWVRLYDHTAVVELWDGTPLTGRDLAQFLLEQEIPLVWDIQGVCGNASCNQQICRGSVCTYADDVPGVDPIYIFPGHAGNMPALVATLAHESFHRMQRFGLVKDSKFEEYWACRVTAAFDPNSGFKFDGYDPLVGGYLLLWVRDNGLTPYYALPDYPDGFTPAAASAAQP